MDLNRQSRDSGFGEGSLRTLLLGAAAVTFLAAQAPAAQLKAHIESANIRVEFDSLLHSRVLAKFDGKEIQLGDFSPSEFVSAADSAIRDFPAASSKQENIRDERGSGRRLTLTGVSGS